MYKSVDKLASFQNEAKYILNFNRQYSFMFRYTVYNNYINVLLVGEPLNHEAWEWYYNIVGEKRCPIADTWWQTGKRIKFGH